MLSSQLISELARLLGPSAVVTRPDDLATYDADATMLVARSPEVVVVPATAEQAATAVALAVAAGLAVVARGAGTGIAGGAVPVRGGMVVSTARMNTIERVEPRSRRALVGAGVVNAELNAHLAPLGLQFAPDPSSQRASTIGGNLATNAGGPHCLKYGVTANHILAVELVRPDGSLVWTGDGNNEWAGYDLTGLVVGSEGTFGLVTRALVRLTPLPEAKRVVLALFPSVVAASAAVSRVIAAGSLPTSLEVMDYNGLRAVNGAYGLGLPEEAGVTLLIIEVDGVEQGLDQALEEILALCRAEGAFELRPARTADEQARVWAARKAVAGAVGRLAPAYLLVDTVVPRTRLPLMLEHVERLSREYAMEVCNVFHAGDGNLHPLVLYDPRDRDQFRRANAIAKAVLALSIAEGGVISGEHGIGLEKQEYLPLLFSPAELELQAALYMVFNQGDHFNPDKLFPLATPPAVLAARRRARLLAARDQGSGIRDQGSANGEQQVAQSASREESGKLSKALHAELASIVGPEHVTRSGANFSLRPGTVDELARSVAACYRAGLRIKPVGTLIHKATDSELSPSLGSPQPSALSLQPSAFAQQPSALAQQPSPRSPQPSALAQQPSALSPQPSAMIATQRIKGVLTYEPDDLTISVEAGMTLAELQALLATNGQILPLERADAAVVTLGELVATAADGPRSLGYATLRDWTLGLTLIEADGTLVRVGAQVVKNVTGYNLTRLLVGSRGTLGIIATVSLRLFPHPPAAATLEIACGERARAFALLDELALSRLLPVAVEYLEGRTGPLSGGPRLYVRAEGHAAAVARHMAELSALAARHGATATAELRGAAEEACWRRVATLAAGELPAANSRLRLCTAPAELGAALEQAAALAAAHGLELTVGARALLGVAYLWVGGSPEALTAWQGTLAAHWPHLTCLAGPGVHAARPLWEQGPAAGLSGAIKAALDPTMALG